MTGDCSVLERGTGVPLGTGMDLLTPKIADITADGVWLSGDLTGEELGLTDAEVSIRRTLSVGLDLRSIERTICLTGVVEGTAVHQCVRCLKDFESPIAFSVCAAYERETKAAAPVAKQDAPWKKKAAPTVEPKLEEPDDDLYYYTGDELDLAPMLREQLILASPMHPLCVEECLGLCAQCGKNLNEGPCHCAAEPTGSPFSPTPVVQFAWRPDGSAIAFSAEDEAPKWEGEARFLNTFEIGAQDIFLRRTLYPTHLWLVPAGGGVATRLTSGLWTVVFVLPPGPPPSGINWSPDGSQIAFAQRIAPESGKSDSTHVAILDLASGTIRPLTNARTYERFPIWSPDGRTIAFRQARERRADKGWLQEVHVGPAARRMLSGLGGPAGAH